jgi:hypothetical protein
MYCSSCGVAVAQGLSYCNYCGAKLNAAKGDSAVKSSEVKPELLVSSMVAVFVLGLAAITILMGVMKTVLGLPVERVLGFTLFPFLLMLLLEGVFLRLLLRRKRAPQEASETMKLRGQETRELDTGQARVLPEPASSVTDHTTRTFDPIYSERQTK